MANDILVKKNANINDTINLIIDRVAVDHKSEFIKVLCQKLNSSDVNRLAFLKRIFFCVHNLVTAKLDPDGRERVYRPETTIANGNGDCKKMTVIICSALKCAGILCYVKHIFYSSGNMTHVYTIVPYPCSKGYLTIDPMQNSIFDSEVQYADENIFDLTGNKIKMDLYTGNRKTNSFTSSFANATGAVWDDINASTGVMCGASQKEKSVLIDVLARNPIHIGKRKKKTKTEKQDHRKKIFRKFAKVGLAAPRFAFLGMVRVNLARLAHILAVAWTEDKGLVQRTWQGVGGDVTQLRKTIIAGSHEQITGCPGCPDKIGVIALAALAAAAAPILITIHDMLHKLKLKKVPQSDLDQLGQTVDDAETLAASDQVTPENITSTSKQAADTGVPSGTDSEKTVPPPSNENVTDHAARYEQAMQQQQQAPEKPPQDATETHEQMYHDALAQQQQQADNTSPNTTPTTTTPSSVPTSGGENFSGLNFRDPAVIHSLIFRGSWYAWIGYEVVKTIFHNIISHF